MTYAKCGALDDALFVSRTLPCRTVFSFSSLISAYADCGRSIEALQMHQCMTEEGIEPNDYTFVSLLKACGNTCNLELGIKLHADARFKGLASDVFVGNTLVSMYGKCRKTAEAKDVFCELSQRDVVSWTAMISAYVEVGQAEEAWMSYRQMRQENVNPNKATIVVILQSCCYIAEKDEALDVEGRSITLMSLEIGRACHVDAHRMGLLPDVLLYNTLVTMYSKCGAVAEAEAALATLHQPHIVSWNAMLSAYVQQREGKSALLLFKKMHEEGVVPELHTIVFSFQACSILACEEGATMIKGQSAIEMALEIGVQLHEDAWRKGCTSDTFVGTALLSMYGKVGKISDAEEVFIAFSQHDITSCNAMLTAYVEQSLGNKALQLYRQMQEEGMSPNQLTFVVCIQGCVALEDEQDVEGTPIKEISLEIVQALHSDAHRKGYASDVLVRNTLISAYNKLGAFTEAHDVFCAMPQRTVVSWTAIILAHVRQSYGHKALQLFRHMQAEGVNPNQLTFVAGLQACASLAELDDLVEDMPPFKAASLEIGRALHADASREGYILDPLVSTTLLSMYGKCGSIMEAESMFTSLSHCHIDSFNAMVLLYLAHGEGERALQMYRTMQKGLVPLNYATFISILQACSETAHLKTCYQVHFDILSVEHDWIPSITASVIHAYGSCASMVDAHVVLDEIPEPQVSSWTACIAGYAGVGNALGTLQMLENLKLAGYKPNGVTITSVLSSCSRMGLVCDGIEHFQCMGREHGLDLKQYSIILDLFGRAGDFKRVNNILEHMPMQPDATIWSCLLGACRLHGHIELAEQAFELAVKLQPKRAASYILMSNIYVENFQEVTEPDLDNVLGRHPLATAR